MTLGADSEAASGKVRNVFCRPKSRLLTSPPLLCCGSVWMDGSVVDRSGDCDIEAQSALTK